MKLRWQGAWTSWIWAGWTVFAAVLCWEPLQAYTSRFRGITLAALVLVGAAAIPAYQWFRLKTALRWELPLLSLLLLIPLTREPLASAVVLWMLLAAYAVGRAIRERLDLRCTSHAAEMVLSLSIGLAALSFCLFVIGLSGLFTPLVLGALLCVPLAVFCKQVLALGLEVRGLYQSWVSDEEMRHPWVSVSLTFGALLVFCSLLVVLAPSNAYDPTALHLPLARFYAEQGGVPWTPLSGYGLYPQGAEVVMGLLHTFAGQAGAQMASPLFFALTALFGLAIVREADVRRSSAVMGLVVAGAIPFMHWAGTVSKNDTVMAFFLTGSLYCCLRGTTEENPYWFRLSIVLLGGAFGVKHVALFGAIPIGLLYLRTLWKRRQVWREGAMLALLFVIFGLGWHTRTFLLTGNPVYPTNPVAAVEALRPDSMRPPETNRVPFYYIPWMIHFDGSEAFDIRAKHPMGAFFVFFIPVWLFVTRKQRNPLEWTCLFFVGMYLFYWGLVWPIVRYAIVPFLIFAMLSVERLRVLRDESRVAMKGLVTATLGATLLFSVLIVGALEINVDQVRLWAGSIDRQEYLIRNFLPYPSLHYLKEKADPKAEILSINNDTRAYAPDLLRFHPHMLTPADGEDRVFELLREPYDYLIVRKLRWTGEVADRVEQSGGRRVHEDPFFSVFELPDHD